MMRFFKKINEEREATIILVSHDKNIADYGKRLITVKDGAIISSAVIESKGMI